ncbi:MAG: hypothetical protein OQK51_25015 [Kangiellaceae bacterium]|nr:hypothetical protein [Kangiellaceae bacterium]
MKPFIESGKYPIWLNEGVVSQSELADLRARNIEVSNFHYVVDIDDEESREEALFTIAEHHPNERIWSESRPKL